MTPFKERMNLYRAYRELNPDKNYWDWKASLEVPAMSTGGRNEEYVAQTDAIPSNDKYRQDAERELNLEEAVWLANHTDNNTGVVSPYYNSIEDTYSGGEGYEEGVPLDKLMGELVIRPEYRSAAEYERTMNRLGGAKGREYFHNAMHELDIPGKIVSVAEWAPGVGDVLDLTSAGIAAALGDYLTAGMMAGMMFLPEFVAKPLSIAKRNSRKFFRRYSNKPNLHAHVSYMNGLDFAVAEQLRREGISETVIVPDFTNDALRRIITPRYAQYVTLMHDRIIPTSLLFELYERVHKLPHDDRMQLYKIIDEDPAYSKFLYDHPDLDPLSQETVDAFLKRLSTSLRGVSFPVETSDDLVNIALSHTSNERHGGDRLYTNDSGLYTSNSGEIGDRFSRPHGDVAKTRSDIGRLRYDFKINKQLPIREQLALARRLIFNVDFADDMIDLNVEHLAKHGYVAKESMYTNRFGQKLPAYERAYFPTERTPLNTPAVQIEDVSTRIGLNDAKGRWGNGGVSSHEIDDELFVGANVGNSLGDYIKLMKTLKSSTHAEWNPQYDLRWRSLTDVSRDTRMARFEQYDNLYRKFRNSTPYKIYDFHRFLVDAKPGYNKTAAEQLVGLGKVGLGLGASAILGRHIIEQSILHDNEFAKSNLFQQIYNNPAFYNNSLVNDDYLLFRRLKHTWNTNNAATLDDFLKEYPQYKKALSNDAVVPAMLYGGENKLLPDPARPYVDEYGIVHRNRYANGTPYEQGLELDPVADAFNPMNDVYDVVQIGKDATEGNWAGVGAGLTLAMVPNVIEKPLRAIGRGIKKRLVKNADEHIATVLPEPTATAIAKNVYAKDVHDYYMRDVFPRMMDNLGVHNSWIEYYANNPDNFLYNIQPNTYFRNKNVSGRYTSITDEVALNDDFVNTVHQKPTLVHENRHRLDSSIELTDEQTDLLRLAYKASAGTKASNMREMVATNTEMRSIIYNAFDDGSGKLTPEFINNRIDAMSDFDLLDLVENVNAYGKQYSKNLRNPDGTINKKAIQDVRNALKYVPVLAAPMMINNTEDKSN